MDDRIVLWRHNTSPVPLCSLSPPTICCLQVRLSKSHIHASHHTSILVLYKLFLHVFLHSVYKPVHIFSQQKRLQNIVYHDNCSFLHNLTPFHSRWRPIPIRLRILPMVAHLHVFHRCIFKTTPHRNIKIQMPVNICDCNIMRMVYRPCANEYFRFQLRAVLVCRLYVCFYRYFQHSFTFAFQPIRYNTNKSAEGYQFLQSACLQRISDSRSAINI